MLSVIIGLIVSLVVGIFEIITGILMFIISHIGVIIKFLFQVIIFIGKFIITYAGVILKFLFQAIIIIGKFLISLIQGILPFIGKAFSLLGKLFASSWKFILSFFTKSGATVLSIAKAPIVAKSIATAVTGTTVALSTGAVQTTKIVTPAVKQATKSTVNLATNSIRRITKLEKNLLQKAKITKVSGKKVAQRNSTFNPKTKDALGRSNKERMKKGLAPIGKDGKSVELHHLKQQNNGKIVELTNKEHNLHSKTLHRYTKKSEIDRQDFDKWKKQYWKERAKDIK